MAIVNRILSLVLFCSLGWGEEARVRCAAGETVVRERVELETLTVEGPCRVGERGSTFVGRRGTAPAGQSLPPYDKRFVDHFPAGNGLVAIGAAEVIVEDTTFREIAGFAVLASGVRKVRIARIAVRDSGSKNAKGRNNTTGGVLLEDGTGDFVVEDSTFVNVLGNGVWTHSRYLHTRNGPGVIRRNRFETLARDAVQVGHASGVEVVDNEMTRIGYPAEAVDVEGLGWAVGVDTAGNVDSSTYARNRMTEMNGKCFDLDGFHHGAVTGNRCVNREEHVYGHFGLVMNNTNPDMQSVGVRIEGNHFEGLRWGGMFLIGSGHVVRGNTLERVQTSKCSEGGGAGCVFVAGEPEMLRTGIYFGARAERAAVTRGNVVTGNTIRGWRMDRKCFGFAPGVNPKENQVSGNVCRHQGN